MASVRLVPLPVKLFLLGLICLLFLLLFTFNGQVKAISDSPWLSNDTPAIENENVTVTRIPHGNRECSDITTLVCTVRTSYGYFNNELRLNFSSFNYPVVSYFGDWRILPIPNSDTVITYFSHPSNGQYLFFTKNFSSSLKLKLTNGNLRYHSDRPPDARLKDKSGQLLLAPDFDGITFSKNGKWMLAHGGGTGFLRVNLETFEVLPFGPKYRFDPGTNPFYQVAISNDGRHAAVAQSKHGGLTLYDLSTCGPVPDKIVGPAQCESKDLFSYLLPKVTGSIVGLTHLRFLDEDTLHLYVIHNDWSGSGNKITKYSVNASGTSPFDYLAMGDSFISGEGLFSYKYGTDFSDNRCHLSQFSYPYLIGNLFEWNAVESVACSGSIIEDVVTADEKAYNERERQGKGKPFNIYNDEIYNNFLPGYRPQINFVTKYQPDVVTISIGGNDIGFGDILFRCLGPGICYESYEDRLELVRQINSKFESLVETYQTIKNNTPGTAKIYIIGYPQIAKAYGKCDNNVHLSAEELEFAEELTTYLNKVIKAAANYAGVYFVDTERALVGYRLCETDRNNVAVNGLTDGDDAPSFLNGPFGKESYHPNGLGHDLLKEKIVSLTQNFTKPMPEPDLSAQPPSENNLDILNAARNGRQTFTTYYGSDLTNDIQERGGLWRTFISGRKYSLKPLSPFKAVLNSEPIQLGSFMTNLNGDLDIQIQTPSNIPPGFHTLHLYGQNIEDTAIDIYKTLYVAASFEDFDGDGIPNSSDACVAIEPSGNDYDKDGIDDACDGQITEPPADTITASASPKTPDTNSAGTISASNHSPEQSDGIKFANTSSPLGGEDSGAQVLGASIKSENQKAPDPINSLFTSKKYSPILIGSLVVLAGSLVVWRYGRG